MNQTPGEKAAISRVRNEIARYWPEAAEELARVYAAFQGGHEAPWIRQSLLRAAKHPASRPAELSHPRRRLAHRLKPPADLLAILDRWIVTSSEALSTTGGTP